MGSTIELSAQNRTLEKICNLYPRATNIDTKIYLYDLDTCIELYERNEIFFDSAIASRIRLETPGILPIETNTDRIVSGIAEEWSHVFRPADPSELSRRRAFPLTDLPEYKCLSNERHYAKAHERIQGTYHHTFPDSFYLVICLDKLSIFRKTGNGFRIRSGSYEIIDDRVIARLDQHFIWDMPSDTLIEQLADKEEYVNIEVCYLLHDCRGRHTNTLINYMHWRKMEPITMLDDLVQRMIKY